MTPRTNGNPSPVAPDWILSTSTGLDQRRLPFLVAPWTVLWPREIVELRRGLSVLGKGYVDVMNADGSQLWVHLVRGHERVLITADEGIDLWRVDSRITADPLEHRRNAEGG